MPALAHLDRWRFAAALGAASAAFGVIAGINPRFAIAAALSFAFLLLVLADLYVGLILFTLLNFAAQVPTVAGAGLSFAKIAGLCWQSPGLRRWRPNRTPGRTSPRRTPASPMCWCCS